MFESLRKVETSGFHVTVSENLHIAALGRLPDKDSHFLLYVPGLSESKEYFISCLESPLFRQFSSIALDTLGVGDASQPDPRKLSYEISNQAKALNNAIEAFEFKKLTFVSHSIGEAIVLEALRQKPRELHSYISLAGGVSGGPIDEASAKKFLSSETIDVMSPLFQKYGLTVADSELVLTQMIGSFLNLKLELEHAFKELTCPRYLIRGQYDSECIGIEGFNKRIIVPNAGHNLTQEAPKILNKHLSMVLNG